ncbi:flagellar biosynthetic protein FliQ [Woodsholea maritima]|uniref:flagellar biosynthetic protein FliQ n=1 Tax=Woodsholea maritima TaxID=240237 RepID=UPI0003643177|nr:flagellar biosynthetic protein FliQ [Woodsholea maritima]
MNMDSTLFLLNEMVWTAGIVAGPILIGTLIVGLIISVIQVATQIQEITLSYVPKMLTAAAILIILGSWMLAQVLQFAIRVYQYIPSIGQ